MEVVANVARACRKKNLSIFVLSYVVQVTSNMARPRGSLLISNKTQQTGFGLWILSTAKSTMIKCDPAGLVPNVLPKVTVRLEVFFSKRALHYFVAYILTCIRQWLSQDRANNVMAELVKLGVEPARMDAKGYGEEHPVADNATEEGRAKNRRISLRVTEK